MALKIAWLTKAIRDLDEQVAYIGEDSPKGARRVGQATREAVERLAYFPKMGRPGRVRGTRELVVPRTPFIVAYRVRTDRIEVLRVMHGARRWPRKL